MTDANNQFDRLATITKLVAEAPNKLGRTALMKCLFFLKALRNVPLPYTFRLYTYGPFDADVLEDLQYAESLGAVESTVSHYQGGYGYEFSAGPQAKEIQSAAGAFVSSHKDSIDWVLREFGERSAVELEMASTIIYIDRALDEKGNPVTVEEIVKKVHDVKPHLAIDAIEKEARRLKKRDLLRADQ